MSSFAGCARPCDGWEVWRLLLYWVLWLHPWPDQPQACGGDGGAEQVAPWSAWCPLHPDPGPCPPELQVWLQTEAGALQQIPVLQWALLQVTTLLCLPLTSDLHCRCICENTEERAVCIASNKIWDPDTCQCHCPLDSLQTCPTGINRVFLDPTSTTLNAVKYKLNVLIVSNIRILVWSDVLLLCSNWYGGK